jgi:hypothetical protein
MLTVVISEAINASTGTVEYPCVIATRVIVLFNKRKENYSTEVVVSPRDLVLRSTLSVVSEVEKQISSNTDVREILRSCPFKSERMIDWNQ